MIRKGLREAEYKIRSTENTNERVLYAATHEIEDVYLYLNSSRNGLSDDQVDAARDKYGRNVVSRGEKESIFKKILKAFADPFTAILIVLAVVSAVTNIWMPAAPEDKNPFTVIIIVSMILISGIMRLIQEERSGTAAAKLSDMIRTTTSVIRPDSETQKEIPLDEVVVGDIVNLSAGDMIPADIRIIFSKDLFISPSSLTGESNPVEKTSKTIEKAVGSITDASDLAFMGSNVVSGSAVGIVAAVGNDTIFGKVAKTLSTKPPKTTFEKGISTVSWILIRFMLVMVPIVFIINGFTKGNWMNAALFAITIAVGLTPEMLPMIVTTCLAKGAVSMSHKKVIIKNLNAIQNLGTIDILCSDKTGTLTQNKVVLEYHQNIYGDEDPSVLRHAFLNSYYQTGLRNLMDIAIIIASKEQEKEDERFQNIDRDYEKIDEIPFDFERRRMSVVVRDRVKNKTELITKGAVEEMIKISPYVKGKDGVIPMTDEIRQMILKQVNDLNEDGMRVIAISVKYNPPAVGAFSVKDECDMILIGYLAFLDPPKETAAGAIKMLNQNGVKVKILTGDNDQVTAAVCRQVGLDVEHLLLESDVDSMSDEELKASAEQTSVFAKLTPLQKARVVTILRENGHSVGYMGDGINDASAMKASDVGISVDTAVDIAKESAPVILLEKNLMVLEDGIIEGRKTYANMIKYIKMTASSNFGNILSVLVASAFLPFLPMTSVQLILLNLIYDICCIAIPWDNVDKEFLDKPRKWEATNITKFMLWMGPVSSAFDITTYILMFFVICPRVCGGTFSSLQTLAARYHFEAVFQSGWFVESMWSQTLVIHMIRTKKIPFIQSRASVQVCLLTLAGITVASVIPFVPFLSEGLGLAPLPEIYFKYMALIVLAYMILSTFVKKMYIRRFGELL